MPESHLGADDHIVIAGSSGLIGRALTASLRAKGARVTRLVRSTPVHDDEVQWSPGSAALDPEVLRGARAVVCLNGATTARLPWTKTYRNTMMRSRVVPARTIADALRRLGEAAPHFVCASGISRYGDVDGRRVTEAAAAGPGYLAQLTTVWEDAASAGGTLTRVAHARLAPVIDPDAVLAPIIRLTKLGLGGRLGPGTQTMPWISLPDAIRAFEHIIANDIAGPVNLIGPHRAAMNDVGFAVARELNRPYLVPAPAFALRLVLRDAADELILNDVDAIPRVLQQTGFTWLHPRAEDAVRHALTED